jgi:predicted TIM-barrel fold metal-dependent hydrolase
MQICRCFGKDRVDGVKLKHSTQVPYFDAKRINTIYISELMRFINREEQYR